MFIATMRTGRHEGKGRPLLPPMPVQILARARRRGHQERVRVPAVADAGEEPRAGADRSAGGEAVMTRRCARPRPRWPSPGRCDARSRCARRAASRARRRGLSETGLYAAGRPGLSSTRRTAPFSPQYPLWSDGAAKARWIYLPPGTAIDTTRPGRLGVSRSARVSGRSSPSTAGRSRRGSSGARPPTAGFSRRMSGMRSRVMLYWHPTKESAESSRSGRDAATTSPERTTAERAMDPSGRDRSDSTRCSSRPIAIRTRSTASRSRRG